MKLVSINPTTEKSIGEFELSSQEVVAEAVKKAQKSFNQWKNTDISQREKVIRKFSHLLEKDKNEVADLVTEEMGKPIQEAKREIDGALKGINWFLSETKRVIQDEDIELEANNLKAEVKFEPLGVVGLITPWNFPISTSCEKIIPALLTGNTAVFKPSELSTFCGLKIDELLKEAGLPTGVFNLVTGDGTTGQHLVLSGVKMISFTGSSKVGKEVASRAGEGLKKVVLELGGSDPFIIFEDVPFDQALEAAVFGRFLNAGQVCVSAKRIFVARKIYPSFLEKFVQKVKALKVDHPLKEETEIGPLVSQEQLEKLEVQVQDALDKRAKLLVGGKRLKRKGYFYEPTVLTDIKDDMLVAKEEVFGPVASVFIFDSQEEVIKRANQTSYGLGASVWTKDMKKAETVVNQIESGMIGVNKFGTYYPACPQGGVKESGLGRESSQYGILEFCQLKTIVISQVN